MRKRIRTYSELILLPTFEERFNYLYLGGRVGEPTFGAERYFNQIFYKSYEWRRIRDQVIIRDDCCDLGITGREIKVPKYIRIHHIDPITMEDIERNSPKLLDLNNLICCLDQTHQAIHYTGWDGVMKDPVERKPNDTCPWKA